MVQRFGDFGKIARGAHGEIVDVVLGEWNTHSRLITRHFQELAGTGVAEGLVPQLSQR